MVRILTITNKSRYTEQNHKSKKSFIVIYIEIIFFPSTSIEYQVMFTVIIVLDILNFCTHALNYLFPIILILFSKIWHILVCCEKFVLKWYSQKLNFIQIWELVYL